MTKLALQRMTISVAVVCLGLFGQGCGKGAEKQVEVDATVTQQQGAQMEELMKKQVEMLQGARPGQTPQQGQSQSQPQTPGQ